MKGVDTKFTNRAQKKLPGALVYLDAHKIYTLEYKYKSQQALVWLGKDRAEAGVILSRILKAIPGTFKDKS